MHLQLDETFHLFGLSGSAVQMCIAQGLVAGGKITAMLTSAVTQGLCDGSGVVSMS